MRIARAMDNQLLQIAAYRDAYARGPGHAQISRKIQECLMLQQGMDEAARKREAAQCVARAYLNEGGIHEKLETVSTFAFEQMDEVDDPVFLYRFVYVTNLQLAVFQLNKAIAKRDELRAAAAASALAGRVSAPDRVDFSGAPLRQLEQELLQMKAAPERLTASSVERKLASIQTELEELYNTFRFQQRQDRKNQFNRFAGRTPEFSDAYEGTGRGCSGKRCPGKLCGGLIRLTRGNGYTSGR
jgi:hypothetical protein